MTVYDCGNDNFAIVGLTKAQYDAVLEFLKPSTGDGCPKCGGTPSRYYFGCDTLGCENYNDGSRVNPALKAKIDASITHD